MTPCKPVVAKHSVPLCLGKVHPAGERVHCNGGRLTDSVGGKVSEYLSAISAIHMATLHPGGTVVKVSPVHEPMERSGVQLVKNNTLTQTEQPFPIKLCS